MFWMLSFAAVAQSVSPRTPQSAAPLNVVVDLTVETTYERNLDLDSARRNDISTIEPDLGVKLEYTLSPQAQAIASIEISKLEELYSERRRRNRSARFVIDEAYLRLLNESRTLELKLGRHPLADEREWYYDEDFDGATLTYDNQRLVVQGAINREQLLDRDLWNADNPDRINNFLASGTYRLFVKSDKNRQFKKVYLGTYLIVRDDREARNDRTIHLGVRSYGEVFRSLEYWADAAIMRGRDGNDRLKGYAFDVAMSYEFDFEHTPYFIFGYAFGSGDDDSTDRTDRSFRQTGLEGNENKFGGVTNYKYYGEAFDPELSNLSIWSLGVGFRPTRRSSVDLIYHRFDLNEMSDELRDAQVEEDLTGNSKAIGEEIDLIVGYRAKGGSSLHLGVGYFIPGKAYEVRDNGFYLNSEIKLVF